MFLGTIRNWKRFRNGSWIAAWNLGTVQNGSCASSRYSLFLGCFHLVLQWWTTYNWIHISSLKACHASKIRTNHQSSAMWRQQFQGSILFFSFSWANQKRHCSSNSHRSNILSLSIRILSAELAWNRTQVKASGFACMQESVFNLCELYIKLHPFPHVHLLSLSSAQWAGVVTPALCRHF